MIDLISILLGGLGLTYVVTHSFILKKLREYITSKNLYLGKLISCPQCFGLWAGFISFLLVRYNLDILVQGLSISFLAFLINKKI